MNDTRVEGDPPLRRRGDQKWECFSVAMGGNRPLIGYCMNQRLVKLIEAGHPLEGLAWRDIWDRQGHPELYELAVSLARCPWITGEDWERDRRLRIAHREKFHSCGHETEQQAIACYQEFLKTWGMREI
jgi:hypothetical protein